MENEQQRRARLDRKKISSQRWRESHREQHRAYQRRWFAQHRTYQRDYYALVPDRFYRYTVKYRYGVENYDEMFAVQNGLCAICDQPETAKGKVNLGVDHDHTTGRVRGLLCVSCNRSLGYWEEGKRKTSRFIRLGLVQRVEEYL